MNIIEFVKTNMDHYLDLANFNPEKLPSHRDGETWGPGQFGWDVRLKREPLSARSRRWLAILDEFNELLEAHGEECSDACNYFWMEGRADKCDVYREIAMTFQNHDAFRSEWILKDDSEEQADYYRHVLKTIEDFIAAHSFVPVEEYAAEHAA